MDTEDGIYHIKNMRKTFGVRRIPKSLFSRCQLDSSIRKTFGKNIDWRTVCGTEDKCWECSLRWTLHVEDLVIPRSKSTAILGRSGAGKTTLLNILGLLDTPDDDTEQFKINIGRKGKKSKWLEYRGRRLRDEDGRATSMDVVRRNNLGFIFQAGNLTANLTAKENAKLPLGLAGSVAQNRVEELLEKLEVRQERHAALPRHLCGGEYQRIAVARALAHNPQVVFADEPTGNLDIDTGNKVMEVLTSWRKAANGTLMLITHNPQHALEYCDHLVVMSNGRVVFQGSSAGQTEGGLLSMY